MEQNEITALTLPVIEKEIRSAYAEANALAVTAKGNARAAVLRMADCGQMLMVAKDHVRGNRNEWLASLGIDPDDPDTNAVVHGGEVFLKSDAALTVLSQLPGWGWVWMLFAVPKPLRDPIYSLIARNRYRIFGKYDACFVPDGELRARVIE